MPEYYAYTTSEIEHSKLSEIEEWIKSETGGNYTILTRNNKLYISGIAVIEDSTAAPYELSNLSSWHEIEVVCFDTAMPSQVAYFDGKGNRYDMPKPQFGAK